MNSRTQARAVQLRGSGMRFGEIADEISLRAFSLYGAGSQDRLRPELACSGRRTECTVRELRASSFEEVDLR
jgi:hypothetical protein